LARGKSHPAALNVRIKNIVKNHSSLESGWTLWFTGLPCSGKSTLARKVGRELQARGNSVEIFDADVLRATLCKGLGFSKADRDENVARIGWVCGTLNTHGVVAVVAAIAPYRDARERLRAIIPRFVEVFVKAPLAVCMERDVKGMYAKAIKGEISNFTGIDDPYEEPLRPDIVVETAKYEIVECVHSILSWLEEASVIQLCAQVDRLPKLRGQNG
jgi:adenylylsulfate kinase